MSSALGDDRTDETDDGDDDDGGNGFVVIDPDDDDATNASARIRPSTIHSLNLNNFLDKAVAVLGCDVNCVDAWLFPPRCTLFRFLKR